MNKRPNILFLMSDEHRADVMGSVGNAVIRTPVLDRLVSSGVRFNNAYCPSPICIPGRQAMMTGQHCKTIGCLKFGDDIAPFSMTFAKRFAQYGYQTVCSGKLHHMGCDQMQGWTMRLAPDAHVGTRYIEGMIEEELHRYQPEEGTGKWSNLKEVQRAGIADNSPGSRKDANTVDEALRFLENYYVNGYYDRPQGHQPLFLKVSLIQPHYPYLTDEEKFNYYLPRVSTYQGDVLFQHPILSRTQCGPDVHVSSREAKRATAAYYGMIETIDGQYGRILNKLEDIGQNIDDWIVVYTSDHGDMMGQHGLWEKTRFFEGSVRVPLIIRWPRGFSGARVVDENVSTIDLFATLCDLAEIKVPDNLDSRSLVGLLTNRGDPWENETISHFSINHLMIKRNHLKYQSYGPEIPEVLFDLEVDPGETINLINETQYVDDVNYFRERRTFFGY